MLKLQRPAILRLIEAKESDKIAEILSQEFSSDGDVDFFEIGEQMEEEGLTGLGAAFTEYIITKH